MQTFVWNTLTAPWEYGPLFALLPHHAGADGLDARTLPLERGTSWEIVTMDHDLWHSMLLLVL